MMIGQAKPSRHFRRPKRKEIYPAGIQPQIAPRLISEPIHDTSSIVRGRIPRPEVPAINFGVAGPDHPPTQPVLNDIMEAARK